MPEKPPEKTKKTKNIGEMDQKSSQYKLLESDFYNPSMTLQEVALKHNVPKGSLSHFFNNTLRNQVIRQVKFEMENYKRTMEAEAKSLLLIADSVKDRPDLLTYQYITKLTPSIQTMLLPSNSPFLFPLPGMTTIESSENEPFVPVQPVEPEEETNP